MRRPLLLACTILFGACFAPQHAAHVGAGALQPFEAPADRPRNSQPSMREHHDVGTVVRTYQPQLHFCYSEGRRLNPALAGAATVAVVIAPTGEVLEARITERSWRGSGVPEVEGCILSRVRAWRFPPADGGDSNHAFSLSFTS